MTVSNAHAHSAWVGLVAQFASSATALLDPCPPTRYCCTPQDGCPYLAVRQGGVHPRVRGGQVHERGVVGRGVPLVPDRVAAVLVPVVRVRHDHGSLVQGGGGHGLQRQGEVHEGQGLRLLGAQRRAQVFVGAAEEVGVGPVAVEVHASAVCKGSGDEGGGGWWVSGGVSEVMGMEDWACGWEPWWRGQVRQDAWRLGNACRVVGGNVGSC